jgi:hypothetical protein
LGEVRHDRIIARIRTALKARVVDRDADRGQTKPAFRSPSAARPMGETGSR